VVLLARSVLYVVGRRQGLSSKQMEEATLSALIEVLVEVVVSSCQMRPGLKEMEVPEAKVQPQQSRLEALVQNWTNPLPFHRPTLPFELSHVLRLLAQPFLPFLLPLSSPWPVVPLWRYRVRESG
jgi:hypothetical protein